MFREVIAPGAFDSSLNNDIRVLFNHDSSQVLGRTTSGTAKVWTDNKGLRFEVVLPQAANHLIESINRGDVDGSSFGFQVRKDLWNKDGDGVVRTLADVNLIEVSVVPFPAYKDANFSLDIRSCYNDEPDLWRYKLELYRKELDGCYIRP